MLKIIIYKIIYQYFIFPQYKIVYYVRIIYKSNVNIHQMSDICWEVFELYVIGKVLINS